MQRLRQSLESLDAALFTLEDKIGANADALSDSRLRETRAIELVRQVSDKLDDAIERVETLLGQS